jgi:hypothetical protein
MRAPSSRLRSVPRVARLTPPPPLPSAAPCQADLIGTAKEGRKDEARRQSLHHRWEAARDEGDLAALVHGVRYGFKRG